MGSEMCIRDSSCAVTSPIEDIASKFYLGQAVGFPVKGEIKLGRGLNSRPNYGPISVKLGGSLTLVKASGNLAGGCNIIDITLGLI